MNRAALMAVFVWCAPTLAAGQVAASARLERYTFAAPDLVGLRSIELRSAPIDFRLPLGSLVRFEGTGGFAEATLTSSLGERKQLSGLSDAELGLVLLGAGGHVLLRGAVAPEVASTSMSLAESQVAALLASDLLAFSLSRWGTGASIGADVGASAPLDGIDLTLLGGFRATRARQVLDVDPQPYRPGRQIRGLASVSGRLGRASAFSLGVGLQEFGKDLLGDDEVYQPGKRIDALVSFAIPMGLDGSALFLAGVRQRDRGDVLADLRAFGRVIGSPKQQIGRVGFRAALVRNRLTLMPDGELRIARSSGVTCYRSYRGGGYDDLCPAEQGWLASAGAALDLRLAGASSGPRVVLTSRAHGRYGALVAVDGYTTDASGVIVSPAAGARSAVTGWELGVGLRVEGGR